MRKIGGYMIFFGLFAIVLNYLDRVPRLLAWIYNWGENIAWIIKIGLIVVGLILVFMERKSTEKTVEEETEK